MIYIITPCTRPFNLSAMKESIPKECKWVVCYDARVKNGPPTIDNAIVLNCPETGVWGNPTRNYAINSIKDMLTDDDWLYILDDDNIIHPDWYDGVKDHLNDHNMICWAQEFPPSSIIKFDGMIRSPATSTPQIGNVDSAQYMVKWKTAKSIQYEIAYVADGKYASDNLTAAKECFVIDKSLSYYNYLRSNKLGNKLFAKICMISMFKNEAHSIKTMLDSVAPYIDFWVLQDNGSTDGTPKIVAEWAENTKIPGFLYTVEEGWVNFGWNRDHLLQTTLAFDHGCDWIMKMDCDEVLEVDDDFDWNPFTDWMHPHLNIQKAQSFHVTSVAPGIIYYRAWIWDARLPWKFNHDPAHETISLEMNEIGENFQRVNLSKKFRMKTGASQGESYSVPTKYVSDALKLEEKMIREGNMLEDRYHFWYIGKSYEDCYRGNFFPLQEEHQKEYAHRCIWYWTQCIKSSGAPDLKANGRINEMFYYALTGIGNVYRYLKNHTEAIRHYELASDWCPRRNDHLLFLAEIYWELRDYKKMLEYTTEMMQPERTIPFPDYYFLINTNMYHDGGDYPRYLHDIATSNAETSNEETALLVNRKNVKNRLWVIDNFYQDPYAVRNFALQQEYENSSDWYKGRRTFKQFLSPYIKSRFEEIMGIKIREWESHGMNGKFQFCVPEDRLVYHYDSQTWAAMIYLTPNAPPSTGTSFYAHKNTSIRHIEDHPEADSCFSGGFYDSTKFELVDTVGNVFNRLVIFDARLFHAASGYFGQNINDSRLFQIFFFD